MRIYLVAAIVLFSLAGILLGYGLPNTIMHPAPGGGVIFYGGSSFLDENGRIVNYYDPIYSQTTVYGIAALIAGILMFALHRTRSKNKDALENPRNRK